MEPPTVLNVGPTEPTPPQPLKGETMSELTPGPWKWELWPSGIALCHNGSRIFGVLENPRRDHPGKADAALIASAPDLLEACQMMLRLLEDEDLDERFDGETECLRAAIAKAEDQPADETADVRTA